MNLEKLLSQEPFNKWLGKFLAEYVRNCSDVYVSRIGSRAYATDTEIVKLFFQVMLRSKTGAFLPMRQLELLFYAWYDENAAYHTNYRPPKMQLIKSLREEHNYVYHKGLWGFENIELVVNTVDEALELVSSEENKLSYLLPNIEPELTPTQMEAQLEFFRQHPEEGDGIDRDEG
jgi:hypothetical protein